MRRFRSLSALALTAFGLAACATTSFDSTWTSPDAASMRGGFQGKKVLAFVLAKQEGTRRAGEDALAREISARGGQGVPGYTVVPPGMTDEAQAKAAMEKSGAVGLVVMRPVSKEKELTVSTWATGPNYGGYWGGYHGYGWGGSWGSTDVRTDTIVTVETLIYSLGRNKLIWAGQSKTTNPSKVDSFVKELAAAAAKELKKSGLTNE